MILEIARLDVKPGLEQEFEQTFRRARAIIESMPGYLRHELRRCIEHERRYLLLVWWRNLEDHTEGFRGSAAYADWSRLLHGFYDPFPEVEHYAHPISPE